MYSKCNAIYSLVIYLFLSAMIFSGSSNICSEYVAMANPVIVVLGTATKGLAIIAHEAYQTYVKQRTQRDNSFSAAMPDAVVLAERFYYEQRKTALEKIKQEFVAIKNRLEIAQGLAPASFTQQFLRQHTYEVIDNVQLVSTTQEKNFSDEQKSKLRQMRECQLALLEKQICDVQFLLALHINQLICNLEYAQTAYDDALSRIQESIVTWNNNTCGMTNEAALRLYKNDLLEEYLIYSIRQALNELVLVAECYRVGASKSIYDSTTIVATLTYLTPIINEKKQWLVQCEQRMLNNLAVAERYFAERNISVTAFKNEAKKEFDKLQKNRTIQILEKIETELVNSSFPGGPEKDDDEELFGKYEDAPYHTKTNNSIKSKAPANGQRALDNSVSVGKNTSRRIGISDGEIVILDQTSPRLFHGHVRIWQDLTQEMKNALVNAGLTTLKGKIK